MRRVIFLCVSVMSAMIGSAHASDLMDVFKDAVLQDPIVEQAKYQSLSNQTALPQAMSGLLPHLDFNGNVARQKVLTGDSNPQDAGLFPPDVTYNSSLYTITLTQPLFNLQSWMSIRAAKETVKQAEATYNAAVQNLIVRTAAAYFNVLQARDNLAFAKSRARANKRQFDEATQRFKVGIDAITTVYEAEAAYDTSTADEISAKIALDNAGEALLNLTNRTYKKIDGLAQVLPLIKPIPSNPEDWVKRAVKQNYTLQASHYAQQAALKNIQVQAAYTTPLISADVSYTNATNQTFTGLSSETRLGGLTAVFPIFDGGNTIAKTNKAKYDYQVASASFVQTYRQTKVSTRQIYNLVMTGISKIEADRQAVKSAESAVESTSAQFTAGTRTIVDVLLAQQHLYEAQSTLANDQYLYLNSTLQLKEMAGTLAPSDLAAINAYLHKKRPC